MSVHTIVHGGKHVIAGNEAYHCQKDGDLARCFNAHGFVLEYNQPEVKVHNADGTVTTVTCPPMVCMVKSATPAYYQSQGLNPDDAGSVEVIDLSLIHI